MTYVDAVEVRRASVGTKALAFGCAIFAVLGSFCGIVWFIRAYVEAPRVNVPAPMVLAAHESTPTVVKPEPVARPAVLEAQAQPAPAALPPPVIAAPPTAREPETSAAGAVADRWLPIDQFGGTPDPAAPPAAPTQAEPGSPPAATTAVEPEIEEVAKGSVPAIAGRAPLPRPKPTITAAVRRVETTPLPRPRPDGPAPQRVWTSVPSNDERVSGQR